MQRQTTLNDRMQNQTPEIEAVEAAFTTFRRQQRRPSNLLQCMDKDGNIDAFRYIEYSRQRRMAFLKRADFICKMKSNLQMHHQQQQQQQQIHRSSSLPGLPNEVFKTSHVVTPEMMHKSLGRRNSMDTMSTTTTSTTPAAPDTLRFLSRSASMPFCSSFAMNQSIGIKRPSLGALQKNASFETSAPRRSLRKEEFEAAEALLFGMSREKSKPKTATEKRTNETCAADDEHDDDDEEKPCLKKQKLSNVGTEEMGSVLSVVSAEEDSNNNNNNSNSNNTLDNSAKSNTVQDDE